MIKTYKILTGKCRDSPLLGWGLFFSDDYREVTVGDYKKIGQNMIYASFYLLIE